MRLWVDMFKFITMCELNIQRVANMTWDAQKLSLLKSLSDEFKQYCRRRKLTSPG